MKKCTHCGAVLEEDAQFCAECGLAVENTEENPDLDTSSLEETETVETEEQDTLLTEEVPAEDTEQIPPPEEDKITQLFPHEESKKQREVPTEPTWTPPPDPKKVARQKRLRIVLAIVSVVLVAVLLFVIYRAVSQPTAPATPAAAMAGWLRQ